MTFQNLLWNIKHRVAYAERNFEKLSLFDVSKFGNAELPMVRSRTE